MSLRKLNVHDFKGPYDCVPAIYNGNSRYLTKGETYNVTLSNQANKVTVQLTFNPKIVMSNGGVQFSIGTFLIEEEDDKMVVNFEDLSPEDQARILEQAKNMVDEENIRKHAVAMYGFKKKELTEEHLEAISNTFKLKPGPEYSAMKQRYISMINYLYKMALNRRYHGNSVKAISTDEEWIVFQDVSNKVKDMMISCHKE